ncbi:MAG TPA: SDR family NAD(P)-dependent oxidoreductase [Bryobacteraceae bacterium]|nr:SDR family NAD(P)-dependent oxidoreductase [Bryobacteraceae bacterium]
MDSDSDFVRGSTALVTGASRGIGAATADALAREGAARVLIHYGGYREGAEKTLAAVRGHGADGELLQADLETDDGIRAFADHLHARAHRIDVLVNNAGSMLRRAKLAEYTEDLYDRVMNLNVKSVLFITQAIAPYMIERGRGAIVNVSSISARTGGGPGSMIYSAAKAAISTLTKGLAKELAPHGVRVNAVSPGTVDNHFHEQFSSRETLENVRQSTPARTLGTNEEVADVIAFLCSEGARFIHGQTIEVNGGTFMI